MERIAPDDTSWPISLARPVARGLATEDGASPTQLKDLHGQLDLHPRKTIVTERSSNCPTERSILPNRAGGMGQDPDAPEMTNDQWEEVRSGKRSPLVVFSALHLRLFAGRDPHGLGRGLLSSSIFPRIIPFLTMTNIDTCGALDPKPLVRSASKHPP